LAFIEQHDPLFLALDIEQLSAFSVEHSLADFDSTAHLSIEAFFTFEAFTEQHDPDFSLLADVFTAQDSPPAKTMDAEATRAATDRAI
jgi:hypothetical protein